MGSISADSQFSAYKTSKRILNGALTFAFGFVFGASTFDTGDPIVSGILGGVTYILILDIAAYGWEAGANRDGISPKQRSIADGMSNASTWASTVMSAVYLVLGSTLFELPDELKEGVGAVALVVITGMLAAHFIRLAHYVKYSPEAVNSRIDALIRSTLQNMEIKQKEEMGEAVIELVGEKMVAHFDAIAAIEADKRFTDMLIKAGHGDQVARPQVREKVEKSGDDTAPPSGKKSVPDDAIVETDTDTMGDPIVMDDLVGKARADQLENLNLAGA